MELCSGAARAACFNAKLPTAAVALVNRRALCVIYKDSDAHLAYKQTTGQLHRWHAETGAATLPVSHTYLHSRTQHRQTQVSFSRRPSKDRGWPILAIPGSPHQDFKDDGASFPRSPGLQTHLNYEESAARQRSQTPRSGGCCAQSTSKSHFKLPIQKPEVKP